MLPTLVFCQDEKGKEVRDKHGSFFNEIEATFVAQVL
jgi:hypothetical protein